MVCALDLEPISVWTNHTSSAQYPHVVSGYYIGQAALEFSVSVVTK